MLEGPQGSQILYGVYARQSPLQSARPSLRGLRRVGEDFASNHFPDVFHRFSRSVPATIGSCRTKDVRSTGTDGLAGHARENVRWPETGCFAGRVGELCAMCRDRLANGPRRRKACDAQGRIGSRAAPKKNVRRTGTVSNAQGCGGSFPLLARWLLPLVGSVALSPCNLGGYPPLLARWRFPLVVSVAPSPCWLGGRFALSARWLLPRVSSVAPCSPVLFCFPVRWSLCFNMLQSIEKYT